LFPDAIAALPALIKLFKDDGILVQHNAMQAVGRMGKASVPALTEALKDSDEQIRTGAVRSLEQIGPDARDAVPALLDLVKGNAASASVLANVRMRPRSASGAPFTNWIETG
jgi:HEAT repeat protein